MQEVIRFGLLGLGIGALYTLASQGLVLIYRGSGVLNLAHGAIGMVAAYVEYELNFNQGVPFVPAFIIAVGAAALLGAMTHLLVMRPLRRASPLARVVATLGVLIILQSLGFKKYHDTVSFPTDPLPTNIVHLWGTVNISADRLILVGIAAALSLILWAVYKYTRFGIGTSAVAENQRSAAALGWSPDVIATANWALGSALAGVAAILIAPIITLQVTNMTTLVLAALAVALVAGFRSFPITLVAGLVIGVVVTEINRYANVPGLGSSVPFFVIVVFMLIRGRSLPLRDFFLQRLPAIGSGRVRPLYVVLGVLVGTILIGFTSADWIVAFTWTFGIALVLLSVVLLTGYAGQLSLAQFAFAGFGAWVAGRLVATQGIPFWLGLIIGVIATVPVGVAFALPAVRTRGINLAIVTLGLGSAIEYMIFDNADYTGGPSGTAVGSPRLFGFDVNPITHPSRYGLMTLFLLVAALLMVANVRRGRSGRRLIAVRTNERAAAALGISVPGAKLYAFGLSAGIAALGGILLAFTFNNITYSTTFTSFQSITSVGYAVIGGIGFLMGPVLGATLAPDGVGTQITNSVLSSLTDWVPLIGGVILVLLVLGNQDGTAKETMLQLRWLGRKLDRFIPAFLKRTPRPPRLPVERREMVPARTLEVQDLTVQYGPVVAVKNVTLTIKPGSILGLIGPNGAGKTTFIDAVTGFTRPTAGRLMLDGQEINRWSAVKRSRAGISRSFQSLELFDDATVLDNLRVASDPRDVGSYLRDLVYPKSPELPGEVVAAIREFGLEDDLSHHAEDLSYGKRRLLAIARAVATQPSVLLLDEPAAGLGDVEAAELANLVRRLADEWGMSILLIEHDMNFVMSVCDEIVVLDFGRKISEGTPDRVRDDPAVIAAYLGTAEDESAAPAPAVGVEHSVTTYEERS